MLIAQTQHYDISLKYWFAALAVNPTEVFVPHIFEKNYLLSPANVAGIVYRFRRYIKVLQNSAGIKSSEPEGAGATFDWLFFDNSKLIDFDC